MFKIIAIAVLLSLPTIGNAQIYRCTSETGTIIFSEVPCAADADVVPSHRLNVNVHDRNVSTPSAYVSPKSRVHTQDCYQSSIVSPSPFMGNNGEIFKLDDGSLWEVKYEYEYLYEYTPIVIICPAQGKLAIKGKSLNIGRVGTIPLVSLEIDTHKTNSQRVICPEGRCRAG